MLVQTCFSRVNRPDTGRSSRYRIWDLTYWVDHATDMASKLA